MNWNMNWEFVYPQKPSFSHWYILPRQGTMQGFRTFSNSTDYEEKGADLPKPNRRIVQPLQEGNLQPDSEYIIWFAFRNESPADFYIRIGLTPAGGKKE